LCDVGRVAVTDCFKLKVFFIIIIMIIIKTIIKKQQQLRNKFCSLL